MKIRDTFINAPVATASAPEKADVAALRALGAEHRAKHGFGNDSAAFTTGDAVMFTTPDGVARNGTVVQASQAPNEWVVEINDNTFNLVPTHELRKAVPTRTAVKALLSGRSQLHETRNAADLGNGVQSLMLDYGHGGMPSEDDVLAYVASKYGAHKRIVDANDRMPGKLIVRIADAGDSGSIAGSDRPGLSQEEIEGTGRIHAENATNGNKPPVPAAPSPDEQDNLIHAATKAVGYLAGRNPAYQFDVTSTELYQRGDGAIACRATFAVQAAATGDALYLAGRKLTAVLTATAAPAVGYVEVCGGVVKTAAFTTDGEVPLETIGLRTAAYDDGLGTVDNRHEDESDGFENGSYVVRAEDLAVLADSDHEAAPKIPLDQINYQREKQRYDTQHGNAADDAAAAEAKAKEYRKRRQREQQQQAPGVQAPPLTAGVSSATDEEDGQVREVLVPPTSPDFHDRAQPMGVEGADETTEEYYEDYYGGEYGKAMTADPPRKHHEAQAVPGTPVQQVVSGLTALSQSRPDVGQQLGKIIGFYLSTGGNLVQALQRVDSTGVLLPKLIYAALTDPIAGKQLGKLYGLNQNNMPPGAVPASSLATGQLPAGAIAPNPDSLPGGPAPLSGGPEPLAGGPQIASKEAAVSVSMYSVFRAMRLEDLMRDGDYLKATVVWDPDDLDHLGTANIRHYVLSFIKGKASNKEYRDLGTIGKPRFTAFDPDAGLAELEFRSSETRASPPEQVPSDGSYHEPNK